MSPKDFNKELIKEVRKNEMLYNLKCRDYRLVNKKEKVWTIIAHKLNASEENCKKRWKNLRDTYKKYIKNCELKPRKKLKWMYFDDMCFLKDYLESKEHSIPAARQLPVLNEPFTDDRSEEELREQDELEEEALYEESFAYEPCLTSDTPSRSSNSATEADRQYENDCSQSSTQQQTQMQQKTSTDLFFESMAKKIKESHLMENEVNAIECKVMTLIYSEIENYRQNLHY